MTRSPPARAKRREDLLVQPIGEIGVLGVRAQVGEGQHREPGPFAEGGPDEPLPGLLCAHGESDPIASAIQNDGMRQTARLAALKETRHDRSASADAGLAA